MQLYFLQLAHLVKIQAAVELQQGACNESSASKWVVLLFVLINSWSNIKHQLFLYENNSFSCLVSVQNIYYVKNQGLHQIK